MRRSPLPLWGLLPLALSGSLDLAVASDAPPANRLDRGVHPWWREALEIPEDAIDALGWPLGRAMIWAEEVNLPERVLDVLYVNEERTAGWFPNFSFGGEIQSAVGLRLFHRDFRGGGEQIEVSSLFATNDLEEKRADGRLYLPSVGSSRFDLLATIFFQEDNDEDFFVGIRPDGSFRLGGDTRDDEDTSYELDQVRARLETGTSLGSGVRVGAAIEPLFGDVEPGGGAEPSIPETIDGFGGTNVLFGGEGFVDWEGRDRPLRSRIGWFARVGAGGWSGVRGETTTGRDFAYARYRVDLRRYQPTIRLDRRFIVRLHLDRVEAIDAVPFWVLPTLDEDHALRGFERNRFREEGALLVNVEYRWPIWDTWDGYLFWDEGQVFRNYSDLAADRFEWSGGGGILLFTERSFVARVQFAKSEEDQLLKIDLEQAF